MTFPCMAISLSPLALRQLSKKEFAYKGTSVEDELTAVAHVGFLITAVIEKDGDTQTNAYVDEFGLYCIDGNWYIAD